MKFFFSFLCFLHMFFLNAEKKCDTIHHSLREMSCFSCKIL